MPHLTGAWDNMQRAWRRVFHRQEDRTPDEVRAIRERMVKALNGELDADVAELEAMLALLRINHGDPNRHR